MMNLWSVTHMASGRRVFGPYVTSLEAVARLEMMPSSYAVTVEMVSDEAATRLLAGCVSEVVADHE